MTAYTLEQVQRMCSRKSVRAWTRAEAKRLAREMHARYGKKYKVYRCSTCRLFHLTTVPQPAPGACVSAEPAAQAGASPHPCDVQGCGAPAETTWVGWVPSYPVRLCAEHRKEVGK